jgi:nucleoside 2-deoxyribosyltransferase
MDGRKVFVIYPSTPRQLGQTLQNVTGQMAGLDSLYVETWEQMDIPGRFILDGILDKLDSSDFLIADITRLNFNVTFEIGYAIGKGKRIIFIINTL